MFTLALRAVVGATLLLPLLSSASAIVFRDAQGRISVTVKGIFVNFKPLRDPEGFRQTVESQIRESWEPAFREAGIQFNLSFEAISAEQAALVSKAELSDNFFLLHDFKHYPITAAVGVGGSVAILAENDEFRLVPKTFAHELGHLLGLDHPPGDPITGVPEIMVPSGQPVTQAQYGLGIPDIGTGLPQVNPEKRVVSQATITEVMKHVNWINATKGVLGYRSWENKKYMQILSSNCFAEINDWFKKLNPEFPPSECLEFR